MGPNVRGVIAAKSSFITLAHTLDHDAGKYPFPHRRARVQDLKRIRPLEIRQLWRHAQAVRFFQQLHGSASDVGVLSGIFGRDKEASSQRAENVFHRVPRYRPIELAPGLRIAGILRRNPVIANEGRGPKKGLTYSD